MRTESFDVELNEFKRYLPLELELIFEIGIQSGLRISDILLIQKKHLKGKSFRIKEKKTGKMKSVKLDKKLLERLQYYVKYKSEEDYIFQGKTLTRPITRQAVWNAFKNAAVKCGAKNNIGTHSMRKQKAVDTLRETGDINQVKDVLNHDNYNSLWTYIYNFKKE
jgi:integrase